MQTVTAIEFTLWQGSLHSSAKTLMTTLDVKLKIIINIMFSCGDLEAKSTCAERACFGSDYQLEL